MFQTVWNVLDGRDPTAGITDYDLFYFDAWDQSWEGEDAVIKRAAGDLCDRRVRPNPVLAPRQVYELKTARWMREWPALTVEAWPEPPA